MNRWAAQFRKAFVYQRGRAVALALLLLYTTLVAWSDLRGAGPPLRAATALTSPFAALRQWLFDAYQAVLPRQTQNQTVAVVGIDEESLRQLGQWPWPRNKLAELIDAIAAYKPLAIGLDMYMPEPDQTSPEQLARGLTQAQPEVTQALEALPSHDAQLAKSLRAFPTVLSMAGFRFESVGTSQTPKTSPVLVHGEGPLERLIRFPYVLASLPALQEAAHGQALVSIEESAVVRRIPLVGAVRDRIVPSLPLEMLRVATDSSAVEVNLDARGVRSVRVADLVVPTQPSGDVWLHYARESNPEQVRRNVPALDLLERRAAPEALQNKLVLVGLTGLGINDYRVTTLGELVPGIQIQAQLIESMLDGRMLLRPAWMVWLEAGLLLGLGGMFIWLVPDAASRTNAQGEREPRHVGWWVMGICAAAVASGFWLFHAHGLLFDGASLSIGLLGLMASLVSSTTLEMEGENRRLVVERQHLHGEMMAAREIQLGSLPRAAQAFPGEHRVAVDALIEPMSDVGGDLYDFFVLDGRNLYFLIGDVSGKGAKSSVFMVVTRTLVKSLARHLSGGPGAILSATNKYLCADNGESLYVTMVLGMLDLETGVVQWVNAGHDAPWLLSAEGALGKIEIPTATFPLGWFDDTAYAVHQTQLRPGDRLCMFTDGITEAANAAQELFGVVRLERALRALGTGTGVEETTRKLREDVAAFVDGAHASDDIAILALQWFGPEGPATVISAG